MTLNFARTASPGLISLLEVTLAAGVVIGHNVLRILPNEVPVLLVVGWVSLRVRSGGWKAVGLSWPRSFGLKPFGAVLLLAIAGALARILIGEYVTAPILDTVFDLQRKAGGIPSFTGNLKLALQWLAFVWVFAAFGEEMVYRGYILNRAAEVGRKSPVAWAAAIVVTCILFGIGHWRGGLVNTIDSGLSAGLVLAAVYFLSGRNLWACILTHGLIDTTAIAFAYFGIS